MSDCIFCKIISGDIPSTKVFEDDDILAIRDINPQTPVHVLVMPKRHLSSLMAMEDRDEGLLGRLMNRARHIAQAEGLEDGGARFVINYGPHAGQTVAHLHIHVMGGRQMGLQQG